MKLFQLGTAAFAALSVRVPEVQAQLLHVPAALSDALLGETLERADASRCEAQVKEDAVLGAAPLWAFVGALSQDSLGSHLSFQLCTRQEA